MTPTYEKGFVDNLFQRLDDKSSLCVLGLCLASNDVVLLQEVLDRDDAGEKAYFFAISLSVLREVARVTRDIEGVPFIACLSGKTRDLLQQLRADLAPYEDDSLTKGTLKPVRDLTFHYDLEKNAEDASVVSSLAEIRGRPELRVRARTGDSSILRYRYTFADEFRGTLLSSYLARVTPDLLSAVAVNIIAFVDSLLADLS